MTATEEYLENQVMTASPHQLHLMVVDGAIRFARQGLEALEESRWEAVRWSLTKARNCLTELLGGIKAEAAPELAERTRTIFMFVYRNLAVAEIEHNIAAVQDSLKLLQMHRETWVELGRKLQSSAQSAMRSIIPEPHLSTGRSWMT